MLFNDVIKKLQNNLSFRLSSLAFFTHVFMQHTNTFAQKCKFQSKQTFSLISELTVLDLSEMSLNGIEYSCYIATE